MKKPQDGLPSLSQLSVKDFVFVSTVIPATIRIIVSEPVAVLPLLLALLLL